MFLKFLYKLFGINRHTDRLGKHLHQLVASMPSYSVINNHGCTSSVQVSCTNFLLTYFPACKRSVCVCVCVCLCEGGRARKAAREGEERDKDIKRESGKDIHLNFFLFIFVICFEFKVPVQLCQHGQAPLHPAWNMF